MRIGWIGFHSEGVPALEAAVEAGYDVAGVVTLEPAGAAKRCAAVDYAEVGRQLNVPVNFVKNINDESALESLRSMELDVGIVLGWSQILRSEALSCAKLGMVGAHASLLPHNRGSAPVNWAILRGETSTGNSLMWLSEGVDEGELIAQREFPITPFDTCATVYERVAESNQEMVIELLANLAAGVRPGKPQPPTDEPVLPRRKPSDGEIDWKQPATDIYNFIRALTRPYPGAYTSIDGEKLKIWNAALLPAGAQDAIEPGTVVGPSISPVSHSCGQVIDCHGGRLLILDAELVTGQQLHGSALSALDWQGCQLGTSVSGAKAVSTIKETQHAA